MKGLNRSRKGFTLVEIMIVVVIIGLLAAMAVPAFQKVRRNSIRSSMDNDARQLASGAQQYYMEHGTTEVGLTYTDTDGRITGDLEEYVKQIGKKYTLTFGGGGSALQVDETFEILHPIGGTRTYSAEGQMVDSTD
jgi:type IV pilus assembly protein PilA